ncbi:MAG: Na/Pi cotransporter family protein [Wolinella sp.]
MSYIDVVIEAFSGLGLFLFGMYYMERAIEDSAGRTFKRMIKDFTATPFKAVLSGTFSAAALQSSTVVALMTLSFVGAGLVSLTSAIGVVFGASFGTTFSAWLVALIGFKVKIDAIALPVIGVGGFILIFNKRSNSKWVAFSRVLLGFGFLFLGLHYLKSSSDFLAASFDFSEYLLYPLPIFVLIGAVLTILIQSSFALAAIALAALNAQVIDFPVAVALIVGSNVGTTTTSLIGALGGGADKKRVAIAHFGFNFIIAIIGYVLLYPLTYLVMETMGLKNDQAVALAMYQTLFNLIGLVILSPFIPWFANVLSRFFASEQNEEVTQYISAVDTSIVDASLEALYKESIHMLECVLRFGSMLLSLNPEEVFNRHKRMWKVLSKDSFKAEDSLPKLYRNIKRLEMRILAYGGEIDYSLLDDDEKLRLTKILQAVRDVSYATKTLKDAKANIDQFNDSDIEYINDNYDRIRYDLVKLFRNIKQILDNEEIENSFHEAQKIAKDMEDENEEAVRVIAQVVKENSIPDDIASSLLNLNRAVYNASDSLLRSLIMLLKLES